MNTHSRFTQSLCCLTVVMATLVGSLTSVAQDGQLSARPLTHQEIHDYGLPEGAQPSGGLFTVGVGQPVYLEAQVPIDIPPTDILGVAWDLTSKPVASAAALAASPLPANLPIYSVSDREVYQVADRMLLKPDVVGKYAVMATVSTTGGDIVLTQEHITASMYLGANTCLLCHDGGALADKRGWMDTGHASFFTEAIDGLKSSHYNEGCIQCHTVGFDTDPLAVNGGFDDVAADTGWTFPTNLTAGNWDAMPEELQDVSNIQCESCHGAGREHAILLGGSGAKDAISVSFSSGDCAQCHEEEPYHTKPIEWNNSRHAVATRYPTGSESRSACVGCHSGIGFVDRIDGISPPRVGYEAITCAACHDPHSAENPHQIRTLADVELNDKSSPGGPTVISEGGKGKLCMNCHKGRRDALTYVKPGAGSSHFGPHYGSQTDMLAGKNAWTYGQNIPSSSHLAAIGDSCVVCHLQENTSGDPASQAKVGGHTFRPRWDGDTPEDHSDDVDLVGACVNCHGPITTFNFPKQDYNGDGIVEGVQTEVEHLLNELAMLLPPVGSTEVSIDSSWSEQLLQAGFNWEFVHNDGSLGVHNLTYAVGLLKASIADLNPDVDKDGLLDDWEWSNLGTLAYNGNDDVDGDGLNNAMEMGALTHPNMIDSDGDGFDDLAELRAGSNPTDPNDTPGFFVKMLPAGELEFPSEAGKTYAIQTISEINAIWTNVETNMPGTGGPLTHLVSTRNGGGQAFYRVVEEAPGQ